MQCAPPCMSTLVVALSFVPSRSNSFSTKSDIHWARDAWAFAAQPQHAASDCCSWHIHSKLVDAIAFVLDVPQRNPSQSQCLIFTYALTTRTSHARSLGARVEVTPSLLRAADFLLLLGSALQPA